MTRTRFLAAAALLLTATLAPAACASGTGSGSTDPARSTPGATATGSYQDQVMAWGRRLAACARAHGAADFPDPVYPADAQPTGLTWGFALFGTVDKPTLARATDGACADIARQVPPAPDALRPPDATTLGHMRQFAQCMRRHGMSDFPDPKADGTFPVANTPYAALSPADPDHPAPAVADADHACRQYSQDWEMRVS